MELGMVGLGKMGANMTVRLVEAGHRLIVTDRNDDAVKGAADKGAVASDSLADLVERLARPRAVWIMVPSGDPTEGVVAELAELVGAGTSSSTAVTATTRTPCGGRRVWKRKGSTTSTSVPAAAYGA